MRNPKPVAKKPPATEKPKRGRGRPAHEPTEATKATVMRLIAVGHTVEETASALGIAIGTLREHYGDLLMTAKMSVRAVLVNTLFKAAYSGNVSAIKKAIEMTGDDQPYQIPTVQAEKVAAEPKAKTKPLGKKEELALAAANPDVSTSMGALMAARNNDTTH